MATRRAGVIEPVDAKPFDWAEWKSNGIGGVGIKPADVPQAELGVHWRTVAEVDFTQIESGFTTGIDPACVEWDIYEPPS